MAFIINGTVIVDETSGTQNAQTSSNAFADNDVSIATLSGAAAEFDLLLAQVAGVGVSPSGVSVSNATAANPTGTALITGLGANVTDLAFTDSLGGALDGDVAKFGAGAGDFLMTADGYKIYLYSYSVLAAARGLPADLAGVDENNVVFGIKANPDGTANVDGAVVFAAYMQPTNSSGVVQSSDLNAAGAKVWMVEYEAIQHGTAGSTATAFDDARILFDPLYVSVANRTDFSLEGAPSGQNLFLMYGDGTPTAGETAIVVTGKHPVNQPGDSSGITAGDTVNTGQGGGKTTIGSNNQMIDPNEGMYFTFVTLSAASEPLTVPALDQNEADVEANITFDTFFGATEAIFKVVQLQPPKGATLLITALNNADETEKGNLFIDGLNDGTGADINGGDDDTLVNVTEVTIMRTLKNGTTYQRTFAADTGTVSDLDAPGGALTLDFTGTTVKIIGAIAGDTVDYKTSGLHNRVLIDNVGNSNAKLNASFDIGGFSLVSSSLVPNQFQALTFQDDGPTAAIALGTSEVITDETAGNQDDDAAGTTAFDPDGAGGNVATTLAAMFAIAGAGTDTNLPQYAVSAGAVVTTTGGSGGTDGVKSTVFSLEIVGGNGTDSLLETTGGMNVVLFKEGELIVGRYDAANGAVDGTDPAAFAIAIDQDGKLAVAQYVSLKHPTAGDGTSPAGSHDERVDLTGLVNAVVTVTDNDDDTAASSTAVGDKINFDDDGPAAGGALGTNEVTVDETAGSQDDDVAAATTFDKEGDGSSVALSALFAVANAGTDTNLPQYALSGGAVVTSTGSAGGTDGLKSTAFALAIVGGDGTDSLLDTTDGKNIVLFKEGDLIVGRYDAANGAVSGADPAAFAIAIDQAGRLAVAQYVSLKHPTPGDGTTPAGSYDERMDLANLVNAVITATDNDDDTASTTVAVGDRINFDDDGLSVSFGNLVGTGSVNPQYGYWMRDAGTDGVFPGVTGLDINATGFTIVRPDNTTVAGTVTLEPAGGSPDANGNYLFSGSLSGDFDNNAGTTDAPINYFLTALADGTYKLDLVNGFVSTTTTVSTIDGLTAGGPDPVQTLTPGAGLHPAAPQNDKQIIFFNVLATDTESEIESMIGGTPDLTEENIETNAAFDPLLGTEAMNVSTAGIGIGNNNLNGSNTSSSGLDESFVANPEFDVTRVKVFIDNSVGGYTPATESLYWTLYYTDGSTSGAPVKVMAGDVIAGAKTNDPVRFDVQGDAGKTIDAIQLTMDTGTIKIPYIEFVTEVAAPANDLQLAFQAILTDGDGDTATSSFSANLYANELAGSFNFVQTGTAGTDAFNIDLLDPKNTYQVNAFTPGADKLVLLGANSYTIDNSGANSIVDITETAGGQHTLVTVMGVDLAAGDIATIV